MANIKIFFLYLFIISLPLSTKADTQALERLHQFFIDKNYRQAKMTKKVLQQMKEENTRESKMQHIQTLYKQISENRRFDPKVKQYALKEIKSSYESIKGAKRQKKNLVGAHSLKRRSPATAVSVAQKKDDSLYDGYRIFLSIGSFIFLGGCIVILFRKNQSLRKKMAEAMPMKNDEDLNESFINSLVKLSASVLPENYYVFYDFSGKITKFSSNTRSLVKGDFDTGMKWSDVLERNFHKVGEGHSSYYMSLHNTQRFLAMKSKSIESLDTNIAQLVEVDREMVFYSREYKKNYYLRKSCGLVDIFENSLLEVSSFRSLNLIDNIMIELEGSDTTLQDENDIRQLFQSISQMIRVIYEKKTIQTSVKFDLFKRNHIIDIKFHDYTFTSLDDPDNADLMGQIESIKLALESLGGSIVVKNLEGGQGMALVQIIFQQVVQRNLFIQERLGG